MVNKLTARIVQRMDTMIDDDPDRPADHARADLLRRVAERVLSAQVSAMLGYPEIPDLGRVVSAEVREGVLHVTKHAVLPPHVACTFGFSVRP